MIKQKKPELLDDQIRSLQWAIGELSKQKQSLDEKVSASRKRDETEEIIQEVNAQRKALDKRISALQEGLEKSSDSGTIQEPHLRDEITGVEGKLEVARERLKVLEQDKYLEELGQNLSGKSPTNPITISSGSNTDAGGLSPALPFESEENRVSELEPVKVKSNRILSDTMNEPTNRLAATEPEANVATDVATDVGTTTAQKPRASISSTGSLVCSEETSQSIHEAAAALDLDAEYVLEKGMQAVLRMIARNGNRMTFPLEVKHIESIS
jgi:FtsZ-binding cell division protein ZapB